MNLRISLIVFVLCVAANTSVYAQSIGLKVGLNRADFGGKHIVDADYRTGWTLGASVAVPVTTNLSIQPEVFVTRKGAESAAYDYSDFPADGPAPPIGAFITEKSGLDYLESTVLLKFSPSEQEQLVRPFFLAGPSLGVLMNAGEIYDTDIKDFMNTTDFGVVIGGGMEYGRWSLEARYTAGLSSMDKDYEMTDRRFPGSIHNHAFMLMAGFRLF